MLLEVRANDLNRVLYAYVNSGVVKVRQTNKSAVVYYGGIGVHLNEMK